LPFVVRMLFFLNILKLFMFMLDLDVSTLINFIVPFEHFECDAPKCWKSYFCCYENDNGINKENIRIIRLEGASTGFTGSPQLPRDTSNSTLGSIAVSVASRIVPCIFRG
jgi:hypothetical protein